MIKSKTLTPLLLAGIFCLMLGLSFAAVPLYDLFCRVTGFGGTTQVSKEASLDTWVVPPKPVTRQKRSYKGTAAKDKPNIKQKIPARSNGVNVLLLIISAYQIRQRYIM